MRVSVVVASPHPRAVTTPTAIAVPLQIAAGTPSPHIPVVTASPLETFPSNSTTQRSGNRKMLTEAQVAKKKVTDRQSQQRRVGKMRELKIQNDAHEATIKSPANSGLGNFISGESKEINRRTLARFRDRS